MNLLFSVFGAKAEHRRPKYCEIKTLAMVVFYEAWKAELRLYRCVFNTDEKEGMVQCHDLLS